ncbi:hypothetical protein GALMADRAFT_225877 [Galerina marginata CBS 339.88]|uniref:F-box domain-containing protein n=1 Tax=Galerina marginata (strain CBS 339.88) TaxID=685588 RepID=A0A067T1I6_GALM3|nr:hypothetical protein GALMADRAFT_225877 [Galerina marginata CBS 339.88]
MVVDLPYDVWLHVASYLSSEEVKRLYSVNRVLFNIAMDLLYNTGFIGSLFHSETHRALTRLIVPDRAARVREFTFQPAGLCKMLLEPRAKQYERKFAFFYDGLSKTIANRPSNTNSSRVQHPMPAEMARKNVIKIMGQMTSLESLKVTILSSDEHRYFNDMRTSFFDPGWTIFGSSLKDINLNIPLEDMERVLPDPRHHQGTLPKLETLSMSLRRAVPSTEACSILLGTILPFVDQNGNNLQSMVLSVADVDFSPLLLKIKHIRALSSFRMKLHFSTTVKIDLTSLRHFLETHQSHLTSLSLDMVFGYYVPQPEIFFAKECLGVKLPRLKTLSLRLHHFPPTYRVGTIPFVHQFRESLVSLDLESEPLFWSLTELKDLLKEFKPNILQELSISVHVFEPALLSILFAKLPNLQALQLHFRLVLPEGYVAGQQTLRFCEQMSHHSFPQWHLRSLNIKPGLHLINSMRDGYKRALVKSLPTVRLFCGLGREEYLSCTNFI